MEVPSEIQELIGDLVYLKAAPASAVRAENALTRKLQALFSQVEEQVIKELMRNGVPSDPVRLRKILAAMEGVTEEYVETIWPEVEQMAVAGRNRAISEIQKQGVSITFQAAPELTKNMKDRLRETIFEASQRTLRRMTGNVMNQLSQSYNKGLGIDEAAQELRNVFQGMKDYELRRIARTEINSAQNFGAERTTQMLSQVSYHQWVAADDDRTRDSHNHLDGQIVKVGEAFSNGLYYPGDKSGPIKEWINCRCRLVPFIVPEGKMVPAGQQWFYEYDLR